ncbi:Ig-like domain-containing protein [Bacillus gobiensis]|uniref:Ig-like domain-containing protein n=1 Tax=Bacillus gobiensis TaxID=1441095 RepID=UPI003D1F5076
MKLNQFKKAAAIAAVFLLTLGMFFAAPGISAKAAENPMNVTPDPNAPKGNVKKVIPTFTGDAKTTKGFTWYTTHASGTSDLQIVEKTNETPDFSKAKKFTGISYVSTNDKEEIVHKAEAKGLKANTVYQYRVGDEKLGIWSEVGTVKTAPESGAFTFMNLTDPQAKTEEEAILAAQTFNKAAETIKGESFMAVTGDFVDKGNIEDQWDWLIENSKQTWGNTTVAPAAGNHEKQPNSFIDHFNIQEAPGSDTTTGAYYSYDYSNTHFVVLNNNEDSEEYADFTPAQMKWMKSDIQKAKANGARWVIVLMHKGPYTTSNHATDSDIIDENGVRNKIAPVIAELGVDFVFQGHDHIYVRSKPINKENKATEQTKIKEMINGKSIEYTVNPDGSIYFIPATSGPKVYYKNQDPILGDEFYSKFELADENHAAKYGSDPEDSSRPVRGAIQNFASVTINDNRLTVVSYEIDRNKGMDPYIIDQFGIEKKDVQAPAKPKVDDVSDADAFVTGTADANAKVTIKSGNNELGSASADKNGKFKAEIPKQKPGTELTVYAEDADGNKSEEVKVTVSDKTAPAKPKVNEVNNEDTAVTGKTEANVKVTVKAGNTELGSASADKEGNFKIAMEKQAANTELVISAEDMSGNKSEETKIKVVKKEVSAEPISNTNENDDDSKVSGNDESSDDSGQNNDVNDNQDSTGNSIDDESENELPDTATNMYTWLLIGAAFIVIGGVSFIVNRRKMV